MDTFMDEIKNIKMLTRVVAVAVLINFVIIAVLVGLMLLALIQLILQLLGY